MRTTHSQLDEHHVYAPLTSIKDDRLVRRDGMPVTVLEVRAIDIELTSGQARDGVLGGFRAYLNALDHPVQFLVRQAPPDFSVYASGIRSGLPTGSPQGLVDVAGALERLVGGLSERAGVVDRRFYAVLPGAHRTRARGDSALDERVARTAAALARIGLAVVWLDGEALRAFWEACLGGMTTLPAAAPGEGVPQLEIGAASLRVGDRSAVAMALEKWPRHLYPGWLGQLLTLGAPMDLSIHVSPEDPATSARRLEWRRVQMESTRSLALKRGKDASSEEELALADLARLRDDLQRGNERLFQAAVFALVRADTAETLRKAVSTVQAHVAGSLGVLHALRFRQEPAFRSVLPLALNPAAGWKRVDTSSLVCLFPFAPPDLDTRRGSLLGMDVRSGCPVILDAHDEDTFLNANAVVMAQSGAGKSYATKVGVVRGLLRGITHYVIDPEGEYAALAGPVRGRVIKPGAPGQGLNPFALGTTDEVSVAYKVGGLRRLLEVMVGDRLSPPRRAALDSYLSDYYRAGPASASFDGFYRSLDPDSLFATTLRPFAEGSLRFLLSDGESQDLPEPPLTVFDLSHLDPDLRPAVAHLCAESVWSLADRAPKPRVLVIDEAWALLQHPEGAAFLSSVAKRARKHGLGVVAITQDVQDFLEGQGDGAISGHSGRTLVQNSAFKLLLRQDASALDMVTSAFHLSPTERQWVLTCARGEGLLITPAGRALLRIESTLEEHRLITAARTMPATSSQGRYT